jgi:hypothetical protein
MSTHLDDVVAEPTRASAAQDAISARGTHRRRWTVLSWIAVLALGGVTAFLIVAVSRPDRPAIDLDNVHTVAEHGSVNAIGHRDALIVAARHTPSQTFAEHGSVNAIEHREAPLGRS